MVIYQQPKRVNEVVIRFSAPSSALGIASWCAEGPENGNKMMAQKVNTFWNYHVYLNIYIYNLYLSICIQSTSIYIYVYMYTQTLIIEYYQKMLKY